MHPDQYQNVAYVDETEKSNITRNQRNKIPPYTESLSPSIRAGLSSIFSMFRVV
jgi:hypothetical protein